MEKRRELTDPQSCLSRAHDDEYLFVLLGRDPAAAGTIQRWAELRVDLRKNQPGDDQITHALNDARLLRWLQERNPHDPGAPGVYVRTPRPPEPDEEVLTQLHDLALRLAKNDASAAERLLLRARTTLHHDACLREKRPL